MDHYFTNNTNLKSEINTLSFSYDKYDFVFASDNGVFSKKKVDYGSFLLLDTFLKNSQKRGNILDLGCGYGFIGIVLAKMLSSPVTMCDINKRALHLAKMNAEKNKIKADIIESNAFSNINDKYDIIITNPPVHAGKKVTLDFLLGAREHLNPNGELWYVLRKDHGAKSMKETLDQYYQIDLVKKSNGFYIFSCKIC